MTYTTKDGVTIPLDIPEGEKKETRYSQPSFVRACRNNERIASVLDYFIYAAGKEGKGCKVVKVVRTHKQILQGINNPPSRKSLIRYLDNLNEWKLVLSQQYQREFTVDLEAIQEALLNPPQAEPRSQRLQEKGGQVTTLQPFEKVDKLQRSEVEELREKVEQLQQKVDTLQRESGQVTTFCGHITTLQRDFEALQKFVQDHLFSPPIITNNILPVITNKDGVLSSDENTPPPDFSNLDKSFSNGPHQGNAQIIHREHKFIRLDNEHQPTLMVVTLTPTFPHPFYSEMEDKRRERIAAWEVLPIYKKKGLEVEVRWEHETERQTVDAATIIESTAVVGGNSPVQEPTFPQSSASPENMEPHALDNASSEPPNRQKTGVVESQPVNIAPPFTEAPKTAVQTQEMPSSTQGVDESNRQATEQQANGDDPIATSTTKKQRGGKSKGAVDKEEKPKLEVVKTPPQMPPAEMAWGTRKCMQKFDARRGILLIGTYTISQASTCAKGLAENYTEEDVDAVTEKMNNDPYWIARGGADICDVARNIHKEIKKIKGQNRISRSGNQQQTIPDVPAACMTHDEACKLAHDAIAQAKQYGYDIQTQAVTSKKVEGAWIVKVKWDNEDGFVVPPIRTREQWQQEFKSMHENLSIPVPSLAQREAK